MNVPQPAGELEHGDRRLGPTRPAELDVDLEKRPEWEELPCRAGFRKFRTASGTVIVPRGHEPLDLKVEPIEPWS